MKRYTKLNDYYIIDNYTGQKLKQTDTIKRLNTYEQHLQQLKNIELLDFLKKVHEKMEGTTKLDENGVLWTFTNGRWQAGCVPGLKEMKK